MNTALDNEGGEDVFRPLEGLLVVAIEQAVAAPLCTSRLADAGATVIKIERPGGDFARGYDEAALGDSSYFAWINHGKKSVVLDFKQADDAALLERLIGRADVFVQNLAPGALERSGFGSATLRKRYPRLITCDISGYGSGDGVAGLKAYDLLVQAESGLVAVSGAPGEPGRIGVSLCDIGAGVTAHGGVLEALLQRARTDRGTAIAVSLFDVAAEWMSVPLVHAETGQGAPEPVGLKHPSIAPYGAFPDREGMLTLIAIQNEREWQRLCRDVLHAPRLLEHACYRSNVERVSHRDALEAELAALTRQRNAEELRAALRKASIAYGAINSVEELGSHAALRRRNVTNSHGRPVWLPAHPVLLRDAERRRLLAEVRMERSGVAPSPERNRFDTDTVRVPGLGEHTEQIRREFAS